MSFHAALTLRIAAALAFALTVAFATITEPAWALVLTAVAAGGVCMAAPCLSQSGAGGGSFGAAPHAAFRHWRSGALGLALVIITALALGPVLGLAALVVWRAAAEAFATETLLRDLARRLPPESLERGPMRAVQLAAGPAFALALLFGVHGGAVFGQSAGAIPPLATVVIAGIAAVVMLDWAIRRLAEWRIGTASRAISLHVGAHHVLFVCLGVMGTDGAALVLGLAAWRILRFAPPLPGLDSSLPGPTAYRQRARRARTRHAAAR